MEHRWQLCAEKNAESVYRDDARMQLPAVLGRPPRQDDEVMLKVTAGASRGRGHQTREESGKEEVIQLCASHAGIKSPVHRSNGLSSEL